MVFLLFDYYVFTFDCALLGLDIYRKYCRDYDGTIHIMCIMQRYYTYIRTVAHTHTYLDKIVSTEQSTVISDVYLTIAI